MSRIAAAGGAVRPATTFDHARGVTAHYWPQFLPDGRHYLYYQRSSKPEHQGIYVASLVADAIGDAHGFPACAERLIVERLCE